MTTIPLPIDSATTPAPRPHRRIRRTLLRLALLAVVLALAVPGSLLLRPWLDGNVGVVDPGLVIRSAQPTSQLARLIHDHQPQGRS